VNDVVALTCDLIARASVTPEDAGCQALLAGRLERAGFHCEHLRLGEVDNLWATGAGAARAYRCGADRPGFGLDQ